MAISPKALSRPRSCRIYHVLFHTDIPAPTSANLSFDSYMSIWISFLANLSSTTARLRPPIPPPLKNNGGCYYEIDRSWYSRQAYHIAIRSFFETIDEWNEKFKRVHSRWSRFKEWPSSRSYTRGCRSLWGKCLLLSHVPWMLIPCRESYGGNEIVQNTNVPSWRLCITTNSCTIPASIEPTALNQLPIAWKTPTRINSHARATWSTPIRDKWHIWV